MILRKPYAFLIKHFKMIHLMMMGIIIFLLVKTAGIYSFIDGYLESNAIVIGDELTDVLFGPSMYISTIILILLLTSILVLMANKKKPIFFYVTNIAINVFTFAFFVLAQSFIAKMEIQIVDIRIIRILHDGTVALLSAQFISSILMSVRATGFDVKKFNFVKDLEELDIKEEDNEEFEVNFELNLDSLKRLISKRVRHLKYIYLENRLIMRILVIIITIMLVFGLYRVYSKKGELYNQNQYFNTSTYNIGVLNTYVTTKIYNGNLASENHTLGIVKIRLKKRFNDSRNNKLATTRFELKIGKHKFYPTNKYRDKVIDFGVNYNDQVVTSDYSEFIFVYEIPNNLVGKYTQFRYLDATGKVYKVSVGMIDLDKDIQTKDIEIGDEEVINPVLFGKSNFSIDDVELNKQFEVNYQYCAGSYTCYDSIDYITPKLNRNYDKAILRIDTTSNVEGNPNFNSMKDILLKLGKVECKNKNEETYHVYSLESRNVPNDEFYDYFELNSEVLNYEEVYLVINARNKVYKYKIV